MKRTFVGVAALVVALGSANAFAAHYGTAGCGIGSLVFNDQPGKIQILAATLNDLISPQTSAITSGTSGCYEDGGREEASLFITINRASLAKDISRGNGETLDNLSHLLKCEDSEKLGSALRQSYDSIFPSSDVSASDVNKSIDQTILNNRELAQSCKTYS